MLAKVHSLATIGLGAEPVEVEVDILGGLPSFTVVGLGDTAVQEARERVRSAVKNSGFTFPARRITANLAPADIRKIGPSYDLPIALGILITSGQIVPPPELDRAIVIGELALDGRLRHVNGILPLTAFAQKAGYAAIFLPAVNAAGAALVEGIKIYPLERLKDLTDHLTGAKKINPAPPTDAALLAREMIYDTDFCHIRGQEHAKRALEIAAAGGHNLLMNGSPGSGKTLMARAMRTIMPRLTRHEMLEITKIYSVASKLPKGTPLITTRPFRAVHHTASAASIVGGGRTPTPGEISLAHKGVPFLDELAEFPSQVLEVLRQPLEDKIITVSRVHGSLTFPAQFTLVAAMNPCPCGFFGIPHAQKECTCSPSAVARYRKKISGPLLDRIDLHVEVSPVKFEKLSTAEDAEPSAKIAARVQAARDRQQARFADTHLTANAEMGIKEIKKFCACPPEGTELLRQAMVRLNLSARGYNRVLKVARTIADLENAPEITLGHLAEALQYRPRENGG